MSHLDNALPRWASSCTTLKAYPDMIYTDLQAVNPSRV
jgi:hypothetical protein